MRPVSLKLKIGVFLAITLTVAMLLFTVLVVRHSRQELLQEATGHVNQLSEVITRSTRFAMLQNQPAYVGQIVQDVGNQKNIEKVRILGKDGTIIHSTYIPEIGTTVGEEAEDCVRCHRTQPSAEKVPACRQQYSLRCWLFPQTRYSGLASRQISHRKSIDLGLREIGLETRLVRGRP